MAAFTAFLERTTQRAQTTVKSEMRVKASCSISGVLVVAAGGLLGSLLHFPLEMLVGQRAPKLVEPVLVVDHLRPAVSGHGVLVLEEDGLLRAYLLAEPAVDAPQHVD